MAEATKTKRKKARLGRPPAAASAETRQRIIEAARDCFGRFGYEKTTNGLIAREAGITSGAIYHYFESKQQLFEAVATETLSTVVTNFRSVTKDRETVVEKLFALLDSAVELNARDPSMATFVSSSPIEIRRHDQLHPVAASEGLETRRFFEEIVNEGKASGEIAADVDTAAVVHMLMATTSGIALYAAFAQNQRAHRATVTAFERLIEGTLFLKSPRG